MSQHDYGSLAAFLQLHCGLESGKSTFNGRDVSLILDKEGIDFLAKFDLAYDTATNSVQINHVINNELFIYYNFEDFTKRYLPNNSFDEIVILVIENEGTFLLKERNVICNSQLIPLFNYDAYKRILAFILESTDFISYDNQSTREFVLISETGVQKIGYDLLEQRVAKFDNLHPLFSRLKDSFKDFEFQGFFKEAVLQTIIRFPQSERFYYLISNLSVLLDIAERDNQLYIKKFGFDKIKSKFKEERKAYFESLEKNLESISKQITAFPLTFSASAFASYQVKDKPLILSLIFLAYLLYTIIAWQILRITNHSIISLKKEMLHEAKSIMQDYKLIYKEFKPDFKKILFKIKQIRVLVIFLRFTFIALLLSFFVFIIYQILLGWDIKRSIFDICYL